ncbi:MAG: hypothetical protein CMJ62_09130 [Planctomycetaceae bacterium]|nr:hypothetical protein [Planctomycetaceae bacterium]
MKHLAFPELPLNPLLECGLRTLIRRSSREQLLNRLLVRLCDRKRHLGKIFKMGNLRSSVNEGVSDSTPRTHVGPTFGNSETSHWVKHISAAIASRDG